MVSLLIKIFIKDNKNITDKKVRLAYGILCGVVGIFFNILLATFKFLAGIFSHSIAICADALNNLSDAASSIITLLGFKLAGQKADSDHPFGHGRFEYISGLIISVVILIMAFELFRSSVAKILKPEDLTYSPLIIIILLSSILVKLYMAYYNNKLGKQINSAAMKATAVDSLSDCLTTSVVLISTLVSHFAGVYIDAYCGVIVSLVVAFAGYKAMKETINPLLGQAPDEDFVKRVTEIVTSHEGIIGIHDLIVHNYGPGNSSLSLHAEVPANLDLITVHNIIDHIEHDIRYELGAMAVIHMDPVMTDDVETNSLREIVKDILKNINSDFSIHDFRIMDIGKAKKIMFDIEVPYNFKTDDYEIKKQISTEIFAKIPDCVLDIEIDRV